MIKDLVLKLKKNIVLFMPLQLLLLFSFSLFPPPPSLTLCPPSAIPRIIVQELWVNVLWLVPLPSFTQSPHPPIHLWMDTWVASTFWLCE